MSEIVSTDTIVKLKIQSFFARYPTQKIKKNTIILQAHNPANNIFKLDAGQVWQYDISPQGHKVVVHVFKPPAFFPMSLAINKTPNLYIYEAATAIKVRIAPPEDVIDFLKHNPEVVYNLLGRVYLGRDVMIRRLAHSMGGKAKTKLMYELLIEGSLLQEENGAGDNVMIPIHVNELALRSGLSRETASRELSKMKHLGINNTSKGVIINSLEILKKELGDSL